LSITARDFSSVIRISAPRWEARRRRVVERRLRELGSGPIGSLFTGIGPNQALVGRRAGALPRASGQALPATAFAQPGLYADVRRDSGVVPTQIAGDLRGAAAGARRDLAVAVNGRIEAVGRSFYLTGDPIEHFAFNVPEPALREGRNTIVVFEVTAGGRLRPLARD
jgi:hypothetical protein